MLINPHISFRLFALSLALLFCLTASAYAQGTAFTYQGRLTDNGNPANGLFDIQLRLFDTQAVGIGTQFGPTFTDGTVQITNGIIVIVDVDFGPNVFTGAARFLEIGIRPAGSADPFTVLEPRQPVTSTPYALRSASAATAGTASNASRLGGIAPEGFIQNTTSFASDLQRARAGRGREVRPGKRGAH